jgi:hypothetical protein
LCFILNFQLQAGIKGDKFSIVYEPEAASVYARLLPVDKFVGENKMVALKTFDLPTICILSVSMVCCILFS